MSASIETLTGAHDVIDFDCGEPARNAWLRSRALTNQRNDDTRTYVAADKSLVLGFYSLAVSSVVRAALPGPMRRNAPDPVSCVLLGQLAIDRRWQGKGLGRELVVHAMQQVDRIAELAGCRLFTVSPVRPDLVSYYGRFGFTEVSAQPPLMAMSLQKVRATLAGLDTPARLRPSGAG